MLNHEISACSNLVRDCFYYNRGRGRPKVTWFDLVLDLPVEVNVAMNGTNGRKNFCSWHQIYSTRLILVFSFLVLVVILLDRVNVPAI